METLTKEITIEIGVISYTFDIEIQYRVTVEKGDYFHPSFSETEIISKEITSEIQAWNNEAEAEYTVTDPSEIKMVEDWIDWDSELEKSF
jgi:hypothetical protein